MLEKRLQETRQYWNNAAPTFDDEPDHGLRDPIVLETWTNFLRASIPEPNATILDIGCGTGSLSVVMAQLGHDVTGIDLSPSMIDIARMKAATSELPISFHVMEAAFPDLPNNQFDVIVCRHLLWALPEPEQVLQRWSNLLKQKGRLILIEGFWDAGGGLRANDILKRLPPDFETLSHQNLSNEPNYWGKNVSDERYAIIAHKKQYQT